MYRLEIIIYSWRKFVIFVFVRGYYILYTKKIMQGNLVYLETINQTNYVTLNFEQIFVQ